MASTSKKALELSEEAVATDQHTGRKPQDASTDNGVVATKKLTELTMEEREQYDRQIRLWGLENQKALRSTAILLAGVGGCGAEILKNILLTGVDSITLLDENAVTEEDFDSQFFLPRDCLGANRAEASIRRAQKLNTTTKLIVDKESLSQKDGDYFHKFDVVIVTGATNAEVLRIDGICRQKGINLFVGDVWGIFGWAFIDLQEHEYLDEIGKFKVVSEPRHKVKTELVTQSVRRSISFPSYQKVLDFDMSSEAYTKKLKRTGPAMILRHVLLTFRDKYKRNPDYKKRASDIAELERIRDEMPNGQMLGSEYFELVFGQVAPANSVLGGVLAQEIIKTITKKGIPLHNVFLFDPVSYYGFVETIV